MIVAIIPARGGSRGLPRKNLRRVGGRSLVELAVRAGLEAPSVARVVVSTDDEAIASVAEGCGAEVPFRRPTRLAADETPTIEVLRHAVAELEASGTTIEMVVTLQPTSPLRGASQVEAAIELVRGGADSAVSVAPLEVPWSVIGYVADGRFIRGEQPPAADVRRQASPTAVRITGAIYVTRRELLDRGLIIGPDAAALMTEAAVAVDVDTEADLRRARRMQRAGS